MPKAIADHIIPTLNLAQRHSYTRSSANPETN